jgi:ATPase subunit of ABC transporter with duplicated ATPase domains
MAELKEVIARLKAQQSSQNLAKKEEARKVELAEQPVEIEEPVENQSITGQLIPKSQPMPPARPEVRQETPGREEDNEVMKEISLLFNEGIYRRELLITLKEINKSQLMIVDKLSQIGEIVGLTKGV